MLPKSRLSLKRSKLILTAAVMLFGVSAPSAQDIDVIHFWTNPGERAALEVFKSAYEATGGRWHSAERKNVSEVRRTAIEWISDGIPPTAIQWHASSNLSTLRNLGVIRPIDELLDTSYLRSHTHPLVLSYIQRDDEITAIPVTIHGDNWAYYNAAIYDQLDLRVPKSWTEFLEQAPKIKEAGFIPLAIGGNTWEHRIIFNTILIDVGGGDLYKSVSTGKELSPEQETQLIEAFDIFLQLSSFVDEDYKALSLWSEATRQVIDGKAGAQIMGDWAKGDLLSAGLVPGKDFYCAMAPGNDKGYLLVVDVFLLPSSTQEESAAAQRTFVDIVLDPENQVEFARRKGSMPVLHNADVTKLDSCSQVAWETLRHPEFQLPAPPLLLDEATSLTIDHFLNRLWDDPDMDAERAAKDFVAEIASAQ